MSTTLLPTPQPLDALLGTAITTSTGVSVAKVVIDVPGVTALVYAGTQSRPPLNRDNGIFPVPAGLEPPHPLPQCNYYVTAIQNDLYVATVDETTHAFTSLGRFPPARVRLMAFGSLPATATLQISQVVHDGKLVPIQANTVGGPASILKTDPQNTQDQGCDPAWDRALPPATISTGLVDASISDVTLDGVPLDVGPDCHTSTPLDLRLIGEPASLGGNYRSVVEGGELTMSRDTRTTEGPVALPLYPNSRDLDIPAFVNCRGANGDDVSRLVTALTSGPDATLSVNQSAVTFALTTLDSPSLCSIFDGQCPQIAPNLPPPTP